MKLLFVCTGNTCRSPMAEAIFNARCPQGYSALSAGVITRGGKPISVNSYEALKEIGIDAQHDSVTVTQDLIYQADLIYGMTKEHTKLLKERFPLCESKIRTFPTDIGDPYGYDLATYRRCRDMISNGIDVILESLCNE